MRAYVEITNLCNRKCSFCPRTNRAPCSVPPGTLRRRLAALSGMEVLFPHLTGEPLFHPDFPEISEVFREAGISVDLTTNGTLLTAANRAAVLANPVFRQINFSLQALAPEETDILDSILDFCGECLARRPELYLNLRFWNLSPELGDPDPSGAFLPRILSRFGIRRPETAIFRPGWRSFPLKGRLYLHGASLFEWPAHSSGCAEPEEESPAHCYGLSGQIGILADGTVVPCCLDSDGGIPLGNLDRQSLAEILHSERAEAIRTGFRQGKAVEPLCRRCTFRTRL